MSIRINPPAISAMIVSPGGLWPDLPVQGLIDFAALPDKISENDLSQVLSMSVADVVALIIRDLSQKPLSTAEQARFKLACWYRALAELIPRLPVSWQLKSDPQSITEIRHRAEWYFEQSNQAVRRIAGAVAISRANCELL